MTPSLPPQSDARYAHLDLAGRIQAAPTAHTAHRGSVPTVYATLDTRRGHQHHRVAFDLGPKAGGSPRRPQEAVRSQGSSTHPGGNEGADKRESSV